MMIRNVNITFASNFDTFIHLHVVDRNVIAVVVYFPWVLTFRYVRTSCI